jgi:hypothetical protein
MSGDILQDKRFRHEFHGFPRTQNAEDFPRTQNAEDKKDAKKEKFDYRFF